ncbi:MAG TPA: hypothetical protein VGM14_01680 [Streptosporangiaceae bacterium]
MSDLTDEMRQLAAGAAAHARPMAVTEVIRRGNHRRTRAIAQRSIGGLSAVGLGAAVLFTGVTHHPGSDPAASGAAAGSETVSVTQSSAGGQLSLRVKYRILPTKKVKVLSVAFSGDSKAVLKKHSDLAVFFGRGLNPGKSGRSVGYVLVLRPNSPHHFSGSLSAKIISDVNKSGAAGEDGSVSLSLESFTKWQPTSNKSAKDVHPSKTVLRSLPAIAILSS